MLPLSSLYPVTRPGRPGLAPLFLLVAAALAAGGCGGRVYLVSSLGPPRAITVDGNEDDWSGALSYAARDRVFVGFVNDRNDLYICMTREESGGRPGAPLGGVTVWIDPSGGTKKALGIRLAGVPPGPGGEEPPGGRQSQDIEILGPNGQVIKRLSPDQAAEAGLEVKSGFAGGSFILEVRFPLRATDAHPFAVGSGSDGVIGVGFMSSPSGRGGRMGGPPGGGMPPGGMGGIGVQGGMGGPGGMQPGMRPNAEPDLGRSLKVWTRVRLSPADGLARATVLGFPPTSAD